MESNGIQKKHRKTVNLLLNPNNKVLLRHPDTQCLAKLKHGRYLLESKCSSYSQIKKNIAFCLTQHIIQ